MHEDKVAYNWMLKEQSKKEGCRGKDDLQAAGETNQANTGFTPLESYDDENVLTTGSQPRSKVTLSLGVVPFMTFQT
ncbi:hypothetical protein PoB_001804800 [Plakobranchus ocellatus]|uniref:Uncharacterized protein n=1 Tax=Plakobranchus ocellatus TaxID=259542 RepID=A0AAV3ZAA4_9GAST|nr:hypothetical protein PoB_001804800 [Plakobranchus ocellatus]